MKKILFAILQLFFLSVNAQNTDSLKRVETKIIPLTNVQEYKISDELTFQYSKPKFWEFINRLPKDFASMGTSFVQKDNLIFFGASVATTAALVPIDQKLIDESRNFGEQIGFEENHTYSDAGKMVPKNISSGIYNLGNGFNMILISGGLLTYGLLKDDYRAIQTSSEIGEGLIASGVFVQTIKRITGRESPFIAEKNGNPGGDWNPFPSFTAYGKNTPYYDAMPSGHLTTIMTTFVIVSENYKEVKWIKPLGYGIMGALCFEMAQSKVHWYSDYPLAVFMGYIVGKNIVKNRIVEKKTMKIGEKYNFKPKFSYSFSANENYTIAGMNIRF
jgi:hypothetical protein